jgi:hypothetical protein
LKAFTNITWGKIYQKLTLWPLLFHQGFHHAHVAGLQRKYGATNPFELPTVVPYQGGGEVVCSFAILSKKAVHFSSNRFW